MEWVWNVGLTEHTGSRTIFKIDYYGVFFHHHSVNCSLILGKNQVSLLTNFDLVKVISQCAFGKCLDRQVFVFGSETKNGN
jgi:hypothetical protein